MVKKYKNLISFIIGRFSRWEKWTIIETDIAMINARSSNKQGVEKFDRNQTLVRNRLNGKLSNVRRKIAKIPENLHNHFSPEAYVCLATDFDLKDLLKGIHSNTEDVSRLEECHYVGSPTSIDELVNDSIETGKVVTEESIRDEEFIDAVETIEKVLDEEPVVREEKFKLRKKIEELQGTLQQYREEYENAGKGYLFFSVDHMVILDGNNFTAELLGKKPAKIAGVPITNVCDPDDWPLLGNFILSLISKKQASAILTFLGPKRRRYPCYISGTLVRGEDGMLGVALNLRKVIAVAS